MSAEEHRSTVRHFINEVIADLVTSGLPGLASPLATGGPRHTERLGAGSEPGPRGRG